MDNRQQQPQRAVSSATLHAAPQVTARPCVCARSHYLYGGLVGSDASRITPPLLSFPLASDVSARGSLSSLTQSSESLTLRVPHGSPPRQDPPSKWRGALRRRRSACGGGPLALPGRGSSADALCPQPSSSGATPWPALACGSARARFASRPLTRGEASRDELAARSGGPTERRLAA